MILIGINGFYVLTLRMKIPTPAHVLQAKSVVGQKRRFGAAPAYRHCARLRTSRPMPITVEKEDIRTHATLAARARKVVLVACVANCLALIKHLTRVAAGRRRFRRVGV
jgi:hypothetical protein